MPDPSILYLHTAPPPRMQGTDAVYQEVDFLRNHFGGEVLGLFPFKKPSSLIPKALYGWHILSKLRQADQRNDINHIFAPILADFPVLHRLKNPTVYSVVATLSYDRPPKNTKYLRNLDVIVVNNSSNLEVLRSWGFENAYLVHTGIDVSPFSKQKLALKSDLRLLMASAPWEKSQFASKGVDLILEVAKTIDQLHVTFLWRDFHVNEMERRLQASGLKDRVTVVNRKVSIQDELEGAHGMILLAQFPELVKSYPHSLIESIVCGKPVILSRSIPMCEMIEKSGSGIVVNQFTRADLIMAISDFKRQYNQLAQGAYEIPPALFDQDVMRANFSKLYERINK